MLALKRLITPLLLLSVAMFGVAFAQDEFFETETIAGEEYAVYGGVETFEPEPFADFDNFDDFDPESGAIIFTAETPGEQHPNVDLVGPFDYAEHIEVSDEGEQVVEDLVPGVYSVAATDDERALAHTLIEVEEGMVTRVNVSLDVRLDVAEAEFAETEFAAEERFVYPDGGFAFGEPEAFEDNEFGAIAVETDNESANFVVTGPNGYSEAFEGTFQAEGLLPGLYVVAGTDDEAERISAATVRVDAAAVISLLPEFEAVAGAEVADDEVAGGGEADDEVVEEPIDDEDMEEEDALDDEVLEAPVDDYDPETEESGEL